MEPANVELVACMRLELSVTTGGMTTAYGTCGLDQSGHLLIDFCRQFRHLTDHERESCRPGGKYGVL